MTLELASTELDLSAFTLDQLAEAASDEFEQTAAHIEGALGHFIRLGEILLVARERVNDGEWIAWLDGIGIYYYQTASRAMRIAHYKDHLPPDAFRVRRNLAGRVLNPSWNNALEYLRGLPDVRSKGNPRYAPEMRQEAKRLRGEGLSFREIASILNVSQNAVRCWCDSEYYRRQRQSNRATKRNRQIAIKALQEKQRREEGEALAHMTGGELANAYSLVRRALAALDKCREAPIAIRHLHKAEDAIVEALRTPDGAP